METATSKPEVEKKREVISFQVSPEEKRKITSMAVKDCGISVSEFVRTKVFLPTPIKEEPRVIESALSEEERGIYEEKLKEQKEEISRLKDELVNQKVRGSKIQAVTENPVKVPENSLLLTLEPELQALLDHIKAHREEKKPTYFTSNGGRETYPFEKFVKLILMRGLRKSYSLNDLNASTGLRLADLSSVCKALGIDDFNL